MDTLLETRPLAPSNDDVYSAPARPIQNRGFVIPASAPGQISVQDKIAGALIAVIMIGPLAAATLTRLAMPN